mgnify:CR=1 FL=1
MKLIKSNALWLAATLLGCSEVFTVIQAVDTKPNEDGFISIFDGKTLNGWEATPAKSAKAWEVKSGKIIGTGDNGRGYLTYSKNKKIAKGYTGFLALGGEIFTVFDKESKFEGKIKEFRRPGAKM